MAIKAPSALDTIKRESGDGVALKSTPHPIGRKVKRGARKSLETALEIAPPKIQAAIAKMVEDRNERKAAFDRKAYQRELMRKRRAADKAKKAKP